MIVGAGIGGLSCAAALLQRGHRVRVYEQAPQLAEIGAGIQLAANSTRVLKHIGVLDELASFAIAPLEYRFRLHSTGEVAQRIPLGRQHEERHGSPYYFAHRADLHRILSARVQDLAPGCIALNSRAVAYDEDTNAACVRFANGESASAELIIGADGLHSPLRQRNVGALPARFTGNVAWRAIVPSAGLPTALHDKVVSVWVGPARHVVIYPLREGQWTNFVGIVEDESWREESFTVKSRWEELEALFVRWHPEVRAVIDAMDHGQCYRSALLDREPVTGWSTARTTLLGDAAHPTLPFMGQGANMAIEDGVVLERALAATATVAEALQCYQRNRYGRTARVQTESAGHQALYHQDSDDALRTALSQRSMDKERAQWLYNYDPLTVALH